MELDPNIPRMFAFRQFDNFRQFAVRQRPSLNQSMGEEFFLKVVVDFIAMTMAFADEVGSISFSAWLPAMSLQGTSQDAWSHP